MSNEIKETFRFLSEKPSLKIVVSSGDVIEFSPYYITQDEGVAAELRKIPNIYEVDSLQGASVNPLPGKMILRDAEGRAKVATPEKTDDIATKGYTDTGLATKAEAVHQHNKNDIDGLEGLDNLVKSVNSHLPDIEGNVTLPIDSVKTVNAQLPDEYGNITIEKGDIGLDMVDNTPDIDKPISKATQAALAELGAVDVKALQEDINGVKERLGYKFLRVKKPGDLGYDANLITENGKYMIIFDDSVETMTQYDPVTDGHYPYNSQIIYLNVETFTLPIPDNKTQKYVMQDCSAPLFYWLKNENTMHRINGDDGEFTDWMELKISITKDNPLPVAYGGTGAKTAEAAREALHVIPKPTFDLTCIGAWWTAFKRPIATDTNKSIRVPNGGSWFVFYVATNGYTQPGDYTGVLESGLMHVVGGTEIYYQPQYPTKGIAFFAFRVY